MSEKKKIFLIDDNELFASTVSAGLQGKLDCSIQVFHTGEDMLEELDEKPDVIILDFQLDSQIKTAKDGMCILKDIMQLAPELNVIMLTTMEDMKNAVDLVKVGAVDYIVKDDTFFDNLVKSVQKVFEIQGLKKELSSLHEKSKKQRKHTLIVVGLLVVVVVILGFIFL